MGYHQLNRKERGKIALMHSQGAREGQIGKVLDRDSSTIHRELKRNRSEQGRYKADHAQAKADARRQAKSGSWKMKNERLVEYIVDKLMQCWSPEQIAGRLPLDYPEDESMRISHSTIYRWLHEERLPQAAALKVRLRHHGHRHGEKRGQFHGIRELRERSKQALKRKRLGDWEVDTIVSARAQQGGLLSVCDRKSRYCGLVLLRRVSAGEAMRGFHFLFGDGSLPLQSATGDRGKEFACFAEFEEKFQSPFYFCRPRSPWQKPSVENQNGLIRQFFPKGTAFSELSQDQVSAVMSMLNHRPRKCLGFHTPTEVLHLG